MAEALRLLRVFHDLTQTELARRLGVSKSFVSELESGSKEPTLSMLARYSEEFGIPVSSLLFFAENLTGSAANQGVADKVLKLLEWIAASQSRDKVGRKPAQRETKIDQQIQRRIRG